MKRTALICGLIGVLAAPGTLWAATAQTGTWQRGCQSGSAFATKNLTPGEYACYTPASGTATDAATPILGVSSCENVDVSMMDDYNGTGSACTVTWTVQECGPWDLSVLTTDALKNAACGTAEGVSALSGDSKRSDLALLYTRMVGGGAGANITSCRIFVKCAYGPGK